MTRAQSATAFDRYNGALCTITFENGLSVNQQDALQLLTLGFRPSCIDGGIAARFYLEFSSGNSVTIRQRCNGGPIPTEDEFQQLLKILGIELPGAAPSIPIAIEKMSSRRRSVANHATA